MNQVSVDPAFPMKLIILALDALDDILKMDIITHVRRKEMKKRNRI